MYRQNRRGLYVGVVVTWILHPDSMAGRPIQWIPTNGTYPDDLKPKE